MSEPSRRDFLTHSAAAVGVLAAGNKILNAADGPPSLTSGADRVPLGKTGIITSLLGMGTGSTGVKHSSNQVKLGEAKFKKLVRYAYDRGITYFDTADQYGSHLYLREALRGLPRDRLFIQTKTHATTPEMARADIERFREELGVDCLDTLLMHCMQKGSWPIDRRPVMDTLAEAKAKGRIRAVGVSCHGMAPLKAAVDCDWIDVDLARINPVGGRAGRMDGTPDEVAACLKAMHAKGKGIIGMKILAEGTLKSPEKQIESLRYVLGLGCLSCFVIGFESEQQIDQIMQRIEMALKG
ncbi:MAG TPA: aldo/keto reductase [Gemmataceae bacterium]|jgi:predicted aldo/keto reductase-like oxidoreductase